MFHQPFTLVIESANLENIWLKSAVKTVEIKLIQNKRKVPHV
jgi:hypothetical protein